MVKVYECAMTGLTEEAGINSNSDNLADLPVGWTKVTMTRRQYNSKWIAIQQVKEATLEALLSQLPEEQRDLQRYVMQIQVEAQMKALEDATPMFLPDVDDVVYLSDSGDILSSINEMRENMGLKPVEGPFGDDGDDEEEADSSDEEEK